MSERADTRGDASPGGELFTPTLQPASRTGWRYRLYRLMFHHETRDERNFDLALIVVILASVLVVLLAITPVLIGRLATAIALGRFTPSTVTSVGLGLKSFGAVALTSAVSAALTAINGLLRRVTVPFKP